MDYRKGRKMDAIKGKYFSITDPKGVNTVIYKVNQTEKEISKMLLNIQLKDYLLQKSLRVI